MRIALLFCFCLSAGGAVAADGPGNPPVQIYPVAPMGASFQNLGVSIAPDGRVIVANNSSVLIFDGAHWQRLKHPSVGPTIWSVVADPDGRLYAAVDGDIGWFQPDATGEYRFTSLTARLPAEAQHFGTVLQIVRSREGVWYNAVSHLLLLRPDGQLEVLTPTASFAGLYGVGDSVWIRQVGVGFVKPIASAAGWQLQAIAGTEIYATQAINGFADLGDDGVLLVHADGELHRWQAGQLSDFAPALWPQLAAVTPKRLLPLRDGRIAISNSRDGPWVIDREGQVQERYGDANGVPALQSFGMAEDAAGGLWVAQQHAIVRIDRGSGVSHYDRVRGIADAQAVERHQGQLYAGGLTGVYRLLTGADGSDRFERIEVSGTTYALDLASSGDWLWVAGTGIRRVRLGADGRVSATETISPASSSQCRRILVSRFHAERILAVCNDQLYAIDDAASAAPQLRVIAPADGTVYALVEADARTLWASVNGPAYRRLVEQADGSYASARFDAGAGVPDHGRLSIYPGSNGPWFTSVDGLLQFDASVGRFVVRRDVPIPEGLSVLLEDDAGNLWVRTIGTDISGVWWKEAGGYRWDDQPFAAYDPVPQVFEIERHGDLVWLARSTGVTRLDLKQRRAPPAAVRPTISSIRDTRADRALALGERLELDRHTRDLRLSFALPAYVLNSDNVYRSRLLGFDDDWSAWDTRAERDYTNLPDGELQFLVEARDAYGRVSAAAPLALIGVPPWWRTGGALIAAALFALLALAGAALLGARWRQRASLQRQQELEATVAARTHELSQKNLLLAEQAERLRAVDALKTRFFTNVGHEFRTPLTLVLGPLDDLLRETRLRLPERARELLELASRNARRVLDLIVELLDVNRLEQGQLPMQRERIDLLTWLRRLEPDWQALADRFGHRLTLTLPPLATLELAVDPAQLERALGNLVGNAAKYTPRGGAIEVSVAVADDGVVLRVSDTGQGIAPQALAHVFDRFYQADSGHAAHGSGIGLALVREIAEGHQGTVEATSTLGAGSCFSLRLPFASADHADDAPTVATTAVTAPEVVVTRELPLALVIDDHADLRLRLTRLLEARFRVVEAADGPGGLAQARQQLPDIIVSDVMMPGYDGVELAKRLRADADTAGIPLLLLTAKAGSEHAVTGLRAGADDYLSKPFDASELLARIDALLALRRRLQQRLASADAVAVGAAPASDDERFRQRLDAAIAAHLGDSQFGVEQLADLMHADRSTLFRRIKELYGQSARDYLREARLKRAFELLSQGAGNVTEVGYAVGFENLSSFARAFRLRFGSAPSAVSRAAEAG